MGLTHKEGKQRLSRPRFSSSATAATAATHLREEHHGTQQPDHTNKYNRAQQQLKQGNEEEKKDVV
jgi:hypothetical protein